MVKQQKHIIVPRTNEIQANRNQSAENNSSSQEESRNSHQNAGTERPPDNSLMFIPSDKVAQALLYSIYDAAEDRVLWHKSRGVPTFVESSKNRHTSDDLDIQVQYGQVSATPKIFWEQMCELNDLTVDILMICWGKWLSTEKDRTDTVLISIDDILRTRGIKPMSKGGYSAGFRKEDRETVAKAIGALDQMFLSVLNLEVYPNRKLEVFQMESKALMVHDRIYRGNMDSTNRVLLGFRIGFGRYSKVLMGELLVQIALLSRKILEYNYSKQDWEKRLGRYFAFQWGIRKSGANYDQPFMVDTLLKAINKSLIIRYPLKTKKRLEKALERLKQDGVIKNWTYAGLSINTLTRNWALSWSRQMVRIEPPDEIIERYRQVAERKRELMKKKRGSQG